LIQTFDCKVESIQTTKTDWRDDHGMGIGEGVDFDDPNSYPDQDNRKEVFVIYCEMRGVYLGGFFNEEYWANENNQGKDVAPNFKTKEEAQGKINELSSPEALEIKKVKSLENYSTIGELWNAGIPAWDPIEVLSF